MAISPWPKPQFFDSNGDPLSGGQLFTYTAGTVSKRTTWTDSALSVANANPIVLDSAGRCTIFVDTSSYKYVLAPSTDSDPPVSPLWTQDNITAAAGAPSSSQYLVMAADGTLTAERVLTAGSGISLTDGGAGAAATVALAAGSSFQQVGGTGGGAVIFSAAGATRAYGFVLLNRITVSKVVWTLQTTDASPSNRYQLGIYDSAGVKVDTTAAFVINGAATGEKTTNLNTTITIGPGKYYFCSSALDANTAFMAGPLGVNPLTFLIHQQVVASVMPASFTPPSDAWARDITNTPLFALVP